MIDNLPHGSAKQYRDTIREQQADLVRLQGVIDHVMRIHHPYYIYDQCEHEHINESEPGVADIPDVGLTCALQYTICQSCCTDGDSQTETCISTHEHGLNIVRCATVGAIA